MKNIFLFIFAFFALQTIQAQEFNGYWEARGFGLYAEITDDQLDLYSYNSISLVPLFSFPLDSNEFGGDLGRLSLQNDLLNFSIYSTLPVPGIIFESRPSIPEVTPPTSNPVINFDIFWTTFEEYCSLFPILDVDWQGQYDLYHPQIDENTSDSLLFEFMGNMIRELNDGHCNLADDANGIIINAGTPPQSLWVNYSDIFFGLLQNKYLDEGSLQGYTNGSTVAAGTLNEGKIGYLIINSFEIGEELEYDDNILFDNVLDQAFDYLEDTESLIIDVRNNKGGFESNSRVLGNRLTKMTQTVFSVQDRLKDAYDSFSDPVSLEITPNGIQYIDKPVMVLTSDLSASATDGFALLAKEIDCLTTVGDTTEGIFSGILERKLPNDWRFTISTQRYLDVNGVDHEQIGVVPDILVEEDFDALMQEDTDNVLEYAINNIASSCEVVSVIDFEEKPDIHVYPNPFTDALTIVATIKDDPSAMITVFNSFGKKVREHRFQNGQMLHLNELPNGLYTIVIQSANKTINSKIVKSAN